MQITQSEWDNYITLLRQVNEKAAFDIVSFCRSRFHIDGNNIVDLTDEQRKELIDYAYGIVQKYGEGYAALTAEMYDATAILEGRYTNPAEIAELADYGDVARSVNGTLKTSHNIEEIAGAATRWVKMAGADTTLKNAVRDGAEFAWIPHGETCAFCLTLASRGWQPASKQIIKNGHAEHIHSNCDCQYAVRYDSNTRIEGYDPDKYYSMYRHADGRTPTEKINAMRREAYADGNAETLIDVN